ncbi:hypothetical protein G3580_15995 [Nitrogeniibacter mangrovi]|uniref:Preprotein translocase subunit YajC n=1 Tax=Nitrogeniibacter mangrovi TaxID=2016596 RepID=A0A6C1B6A3_9RHOO|nr:PP0621 family protein [Nitrogeniibacter mangrovi]QID18987.1 hypothetical protein G3580_15995 [Nitrogeniibacter mangrovi]
MQKLLLFLLVLAAIFWGRRLLREGDQGGASRSRSARRDTPERMLSCRRCGVHVPESEGVHRGDEFYCCDAHAHGRDD